MAHKDIRIPFTIGECHYEAVGFLEDGEDRVPFRVALARTTGEGDLCEADLLHLLKHGSGIPDTLNRGRKLTHCEWLERPGEVKTLINDRGKWIQEGCPPAQLVPSVVLVIRRCAGEKAPEL